MDLSNPFVLIFSILCIAVLLGLGYVARHLVLEHAEKRNNDDPSRPLSNREAKRFTQISSLAQSLAFEVNMIFLKGGQPRSLSEVSDFREFTRNLRPSSMTSQQVRRYIHIMEDFIALVDASPATYTLHRYATLDQWDARNFQANGFSEAAFLDQWKLRMGELMENVRKFQEEGNSAISANAEVAGQRISTLTLRSSMDNNHQSNHGLGALPQVSTQGMSEEESALLNAIVEKYENLPLIEAARVQRALNNVALAQEIQEDLTEEAVTTVNGEPVEELVKRITHGNLERVAPVEKKAEKDRVQALAHDLQVLDIYTENLPMKS